MSNWLTTREAVKSAGAGISGVERDAAIDRLIEDYSRAIERTTRRYFIPRTETRLYRWPPRETGSSVILWLYQDLLSVTTLQIKAQDASPTTIASTDYFLEPNNPGSDGRTRYDRIEINLSSSAAFEGGDTPQRSISVLGSWGFDNETRAAGAISGAGLASSTTATSFACTDPTLIGVGDTLLIESEQVFVSGKASAAEPNADLIDGALTKSMAEDVTVDDASRYIVGERILIDTEEMLIISKNETTEVLGVIRAYNGTTLAAHSNNTAVHVFRTLTIERGVNGTTAATHADTTAITAYEPPPEIKGLCVAEVLSAFAQEQGQWGRSVGQGEGQKEVAGGALAKMRERVTDGYRRVREGAI